MRRLLTHPRSESGQAAPEPATEVLGWPERVDPATALGRFLTPPLEPGCRPRRIRPGERADVCLLHEPLSAALRNPSADLVAATVYDANVIVSGSSD